MQEKKGRKMNQVKEIKKYRIEFAVRVPAQATVEEVSEWARCTIGDIGSMDSDNPLCDADFDPVFGTFKIEELR